MRRNRLTTWITALALLAALPDVSLASAPGDCPGDGDCCVANGTPGCESADCCATVCAADPSCCDTEWDSACAGIAADLCDGCAGLPTGACCFPAGDCLDGLDAETCVAGLGGEYQGDDTICEPGLCGGIEVPANDNCEDRIEVFNGTTEYSNVGATDDGPSLCGAMGADVWFNYNVDFDGVLAIDLCGSTYDTVLTVYDGCGCPADEGTLIDCNDDFCFLGSSLTFEVTAGQCLKLQIGGFAGGTGSGVINITKGPCPGEGDCCDPAGNGTPGCDDEECCIAVCEADSFCCDTEWDSRCAGGAADLCGDLCPPVSGACCFPNGNCGEVTEDGCASLGGAWQGSFTSCADAECPVLPEGACCFEDGSCDERFEADCNLAGGAYQGDFTVCGTGGCDDPSGACCFASGNCAELPEGACAALGGAWQGLFVACASVECPVLPEGACCLPDGSCVDRFEVDCGLAGGAYQGDFTVCGGGDCDDPSGACCFPNGNCSVIGQAACLSNGGEWQGPYVSCEAVECPILAEGACCLLNDTCVIRFEADCVLLDGDYQGDRTTCDDVDCLAPPCPGDTNGDLVVDVQDLTAVILAWGSDDPDADVTGDGVVDVQDLTQVIVEWGACT